MEPLSVTLEVLTDHPETLNEYMHPKKSLPFSYRPRERWLAPRARVTVTDRLLGPDACPPHFLPLAPSCVSFFTNLHHALQSRLYFLGFSNGSVLGWCCN
jgi:hypothetical protein